MPTNVIWRRIWLLLLIAGGIFSALWAGFAFLSSSSEAQRSTNAPVVSAGATTATQPVAAPTLDAVVSSGSSSLDKSLDLETILNDESIVVLINDDWLDQTYVTQVYQSDRAMAAMLGQQSPDAESLLDRLINSELVRQQMQSNGFVYPSDQAAAELSAFMLSQGVDQTQLDGVLVENQISPEFFQRYYAHLKGMELFLQQERVQAVDTYLQDLRESARVSFGPAAEEIVGQMSGIDLAARVPDTTPVPTLVSTPAVITPAPPRESAPTGTEAGQQAPLFVLDALNYDDSVLALEDWQGYAIVLNFFTTWCPYCQKQTPRLVEASEMFSDQPIVFIGVDVEDAKNSVQNYLNKNDIPYPVVLDVDGSLAESYRVRGFPTTYFLDAQGRVVSRHVGVLSASQIENQANNLLFEQAP